MQRSTVPPSVAIQERLQALHKQVEDLKSKVEALQPSADRYAQVRRMNPRQFAEIYQANLAGKGPFDVLVDKSVDRLGVGG